jgi:hypothetical protein
MKKIGKWEMIAEKGPLEIQRPLMGVKALTCDGRHTQSAEAQNSFAQNNSAHNILD